MLWFFIAGWIAGVIGTLMFGRVMARRMDKDGENERS